MFGYHFFGILLEGLYVAYWPIVFQDVVIETALLLMMWWSGGSSWSMRSLTSFVGRTSSWHDFVGAFRMIVFNSSMEKAGSCRVTTLLAVQHICLPAWPVELFLIRQAIVPPFHGESLSLRLPSLRIALRPAVIHQEFNTNKPSRSMTAIHADLVSTTPSPYPHLPLHRCPAVLQTVVFNFVKNLQLFLPSRTGDARGLFRNISIDLSKAFWQLSASSICCGRKCFFASWIDNTYNNTCLSKWSKNNHTIQICPFCSCKRGMTQWLVDTPSTESYPKSIPTLGLYAGLGKMRDIVM